jgi:diguanylate cyclase (GGDEF)-like protein
VERLSAIATDNQVMEAGIPARSPSLKELFARRADPYAEADREAARRWAGVLLLLQSVLVVGLSALTEPDERFGSAGWAVLAAIVVVQMAGAWVLLRRPEHVGDNQLLIVNYVAVALVATLIWLAGGEDSGYLAVYLLWVVFVPASHPPRRVAAFIGFVALAAAAPLVYEGWDREQAAGICGQVVVWVALAGVIIYRVNAFREQRIGLQRGGQEAMRMAVTDALTGLANRRAFGEILTREIGHAERRESPLTLVFADLDGFKEINDRFGHIKGDTYLKRVAEILRGMIREEDLGFRWGGDEFAVLLPGADRRASERVCDRVGAVVTAALEETAGVAIGITFGLAEYRPGMTVDEFVAAADADLMEGKTGTKATNGVD